MKLGLVAEWFKVAILKIVTFDENVESSNLSQTVKINPTDMTPRKPAGRQKAGGFPT